MKVAGKTLDNFFDRGGSMSPIIATTLRVQDSKPVQTKSGKLVYIKSNLCRRFLGEVLLAVAGLHEKGIIHRDLKPQNIMLVENDLSSPFRIIDFGSAVFKGKKPVMDDLSEIYAPPEAPFPDGSNPEAYDIYTIGAPAALTRPPPRYCCPNPCPYCTLTPSLPGWHEPSPPPPSLLLPLPVSLLYTHSLPPWQVSSRCASSCRP